MRGCGPWQRECPEALGQARQPTRAGRPRSRCLAAPSRHRHPGPLIPTPSGPGRTDRGPRRRRRRVRGCRQGPRLGAVRGIRVHIRRARAIHLVTAVQSESHCGQGPQVEVLPVGDELGMGFVPFGPLGNGFLTGTVDTATTFAANDVRGTIPPSTPTTDANRILVTRASVGSPTRSLAHPGRSPWPASRQAAVDRAHRPAPATPIRITENVGATGIALSADEVIDLNTLADRIGVSGDRYNPQHMAMIGF